MYHTAKLAGVVIAFIGFLVFVQAGFSEPLSGKPSSATWGMDSTPLRAASSQDYRIDVYWQNDGGYIKPTANTDRHYTNGTAINFTYKPDWADEIASALPGSENFDATGTAAGLSFGQLIFTPENTQTTAPLPGDWPYSGYIFLSGYWQRANEHVFDQVQLNLGLVGQSALGEQVQNQFHRLIGIDTVKGWDNQLHDEVTGGILLRRKWRYSLGQFQALHKQWQAQIIPQAALALGTVHRYIEAKALIRLGFNLPDDFGPGALGDPAAFTGKRTSGWSFYGFGAVGGRAVEHNLFLQGNTFYNNPNGIGVDPKPLVGAVTWGVAFSYGGRDWSAKFAYFQKFMTEEFYGQDGSDAYGSWTFALVRRF